MVHRKKLPHDRPPATACILRLSALGDTCHAVPVVRALQRAWPRTKLTWIIGKAESRLMELIDGVEFITVDKRAGLAARRDLQARLRGRRFDVLLHMQLSFRASLVASVVPAAIRLGFDKARARELQWLFTNERIAPRSREHVLDSFLGFLEALGIGDRALRWDVPLPPAALEYAQRLIPDSRPTLLISPCSSHSRRNWRPAAYAAVADHAAQALRLRVALCGGPSAAERAMGDAILANMRTQPLDLIGRDTLKRALALYQRA